MSRHVLSITLVAMLLAGGIAFLIWKKPSPGVQPAEALPVEPWSPDTTYIFSDRSDPIWEFMYVARGSDVIVQRAVFPGYASREWYRCTAPRSVMEEIKKWAVRPGCVHPPFSPHGPPYGVFRLSSDERKERGEAWFAVSPEVTGWFGTLRREFVKDQYRVHELPAWVTTNSRVKKYFGFWE